MRKLLLVVMGISIASLFWVRFFPVPTTLYMIKEQARLGSIKHDWIATDELPDHVRLAFLAAEDANFCDHNGVEWALLWQLAREGGQRGGSTITQQMVKNVWLWQGKSRNSRLVRKAIEVPSAAIVDALYSKDRILEVYLNSIEFDTGVFGIEAAALHHYGIPASALSREQAARLAAVLPSPKRYQAVPPTPYIQKRSRSIVAGARDLATTGRGSCVMN